MFHLSDTNLHLSPGSFVTPDLRGLPVAVCRFNPTIAVIDEILWMLYRSIRSIDDPMTAPRELISCRLSQNLEIEPGTVSNISSRIRDPSGAHNWHADPRFFLFQGQYWIWYHDNFRMYAFPWSARVGELIEPLPFHPIGFQLRKRERNWGLFGGPTDISSDKTMLAVYEIIPHRILTVTKSTRCFEVTPSYITWPNPVWPVERYGEPHGGTTPICIGDHWFSFFQSSRVLHHGSRRKVYYIGFYGFDRRPPYPIKYMTAEPILSGLDFPGPFSFWNEYAVAYPSGAVLLDDRWIVALGIHDREFKFIIYSHDFLLERCLKV
jgi:predicted GH43/DUF377 family glycosyl hydrolase